MKIFELYCMESKKMHTVKFQIVKSKRNNGKKMILIFCCRIEASVQAIRMTQVEIQLDTSGVKKISPK